MVAAPRLCTIPDERRAPTEANRLSRSRARENAASRLWAGIHFRSACEVGLQLGRAVGQAVIDRAKRDGAG
ncbi:MAG TPA: hypothetical protein VGM69_26215 [Chloroflexota bacterium]